jgi:hypothetical protein
VPPLAIEDVKQVVVHIWIGSLMLDLSAVQNIEDRSLRPALQDQEETFLDTGG